MSLDAGGLAQMTYNNNSFGGGIGLPTSGFASRGRGANIKRLSVAPPSNIATIDENQPTQPRTSRSHLLAGLRTAPKSPAVPTSAPPTQSQQPGSFNEGHYSGRDNQLPQFAMPKTAGSATFPNGFHDQYGAGGVGHVYSPDQILAPPAIQIGDANGDLQMDPHLYDELVRTNQYLAQQQMRLQQQLINVTAAAQQYQQMNLNQAQSPYGQAQMPAGTSVYNSQLQNGMQPIVEAVPNSPGLYAVYNPMTGQTSYFFDRNSQQPQNEPGRATFSNGELSSSPPPPTPTFRAQVSPPPESQTPSSVSNWRSSTPPKTTSSPPREEATPLPPPSANAYRPGHRKMLSLASNGPGSPAAESPKTAGLKSAGLPPTPVTGTFGPGQAREGEHPIRQPRGPPSLEELVAKPTSKFEGSKNFATRQRRRAVNNLVRAGIERRGASRGAGSFDSADSGTPTSERDVNFAGSDGESVRSGSASLSGKPSLGNMRTSPISAIGSERAELKERSRERCSVDSYTAASMSSEDGSVIGGKLVEIKSEAPKDEGKRRSNLLLLANADKRRSLIY